VGARWSSAALNGDEPFLAAASFYSLPSETWLHLHLQAEAPFDSHFRLMASAAATGNSFAGNVRGRVAAVCVWTRALSAADWSASAGILR
jgi:hypothetical protein